MKPEVMIVYGKAPNHLSIETGSSSCYGRTTLRFIICLIIGVWVQFPEPLPAQVQARPMGIDEDFTLFHGTSLCQSKDGHYWIGTQKGFFRSNGQRVWQYQIYDPESTIQHTQNVQSDIFTDHNGRLWFSTYAALHRFDPITETFITRQINNNNLVVEDSYRVFHHNASLGQLWLLAGNRLWSYDIKEDDFRPLSASSTAFIFSVYKDSIKNTTYIYGGGWMYKGFEVTEIDHNGNLLDYRILPVNESVLVSYPISADSVLIGTSKGLSLVLIKQQSVTVTPLPFGNTGGSLFDIKRKTNGNFLLCDYVNGVFELDFDKQELRLLFKNEHNYEKAFAINDGSWAISQPMQQFIVLSEHDSLFKYEYAATSQDQIIDMTQDSSGTLYMLKNSGEIFYTEGLSGDWQVFNKEAPSTNKRVNIRSLGLAKNQVNVLHTGGISTYSRSGQLKSRYSTSKKLLEGWISGPVAQQFVLTEDGMRRYDVSEDTLKTFVVPELSFPDEKYELSNYFMLQDGSFLLTYKGQTLFHVDYSLSGYRIRHKTKIPGYSTCARLGINDEIYVGTNNGIYVLNDGEISLLNPIDERLDGIYVNSLVIDNNKNIWLGTQKGLYSVNLLSKRLAFFSETDGLPTTRFSNTPAILRRDGQISMTTEKGLITFHPDKLLQQQQKPIIPYIDKIWINDVLKTQDTASAYLNNIDLSYKKNTIFLKVDHPSVNGSPLSALRFQLIGYEDFSSEVKIPYTIRYPNLPPGAYTLQLTAINQNGLPSGQKSLKITINPPWWNTWWARVAALLLVALIAAAIYIAGLRRERLKQQRLSEQQARLAAERDRIAGEVHDDLGGQISSILYLSEEMLLTGATTDNAYELSRIHELSRTSLQNVRDIIFALDNRRATLAALGEQLRGAGTEFFTDRKIAFTCTDTFSRPDFYLTSRQKRNLTLIVKEAWHNTAKHAAATAVTLDITQVNGTLHLTYADNGKGFTSTKPEKATGGYGIDNMTEKAEAIGATATLDSAPGRGTTLNIFWPLPEQT